MRVGVLTGGGDCPGLNAVIRGLVRKAERVYGDEVIGFLDGYLGLLEDRWIPLDVEACRGILPRGGTIIGTTRHTPYMVEGGVEIVKETLARHDIEALVVIGGEGTLSCANRLHEEGVPIVGIPKTIDNDVGGTEMTFGFDTAVQIATDAIDRLHTTAESHNRVMVVEVMGRHVGHIATWAGIAGGATVTLVPEEPFDIQAVCDSLVRRHERGRFASIVVVAEGAVPAEGTMTVPEPTVDEYGHQRLGGIVNVVASEIEARTGFETRVTVLGHVQRGGTPTAFDRVLSTWYGVSAMEAAHDRDFGTMVALRNGEVVRAPLAESIAELKYTHPDLLDAMRTFFS
ncbi:MAG: pyrophosphate--fructose 6-phosphate 1-phosphotransferase [Acidimicrobiales bacterium]|nr:MAG: pyrophosphate--fructose 6-phosphate 1-phosphotransferase [Acidimicrobiales bacterium]